MLLLGGENPCPVLGEDGECIWKYMSTHTVCVSGVICAQHCTDPFSCSISELQLRVQQSGAEQPLHRAWSRPAGASVDCQACCESLRGKIKSSMPEFGVIIVLLVGA